RVAIRFRARDRFGGEIAAGAGAVIGDDPAAERLLHRLLQEPSDDVDAGAGWKSHQDGDRMRRPGLRHRSYWEEEDQEREAHAAIIHALESPLSARARRHRAWHFPYGARGEHVHLPRYHVEVPGAALSGAGDRVGALCRAHGADGRAARAAHG